MKRIAFIFSHGPHGNASGREGLDALLAMSAFTEDIGVFFLSDGVLQLLPEQRPEEILARDYISTFGVLPLYDIEQIYVCKIALEERGFLFDHTFVLDVTPLDADNLHRQLASFDTILTF